MRTNMIIIAVLCTVVFPLRAQNSVADRLLSEPAFQDSVIATIVPNHTLMSKLIDKIAEDRQRHEMVIQHLTRLLNTSTSGHDVHDHASHQTMSHYAGDETRDIKALSPDEEKGLADGEGMGFAMAAELNHYPGPRHVIDLRTQLQLTADQEASLDASYQRMHTKAVTLGRQLIEQERSLDRAFASRTITPTSLRTLTSRIEDLRGQLRSVHLAAHLEAREVLTQHQIELYDQLRGYQKQR